MFVSCFLLQVLVVIISPVVASLPAFELYATWHVVTHARRPIRTHGGSV